MSTLKTVNITERKCYIIEKLNIIDHQTKCKRLKDLRHGVPSRSPPTTGQCPGRPMWGRGSNSGWAINRILIAISILGSNYLFFFSQFSVAKCFFGKDMLNKYIMFSNSKIIVSIMGISLLTKIIVIMILFHNAAALCQTLWWSQCLTPWSQCLTPWSQCLTPRWSQCLTPSGLSV